MHDLGVDDKLTAQCKKFTNKRRVKVFDKLEANEQRRFNAFMEAFPQQPFTKEIDKVSLFNHYLHCVVYHITPWGEAKARYFGPSTAHVDFEDLRWPAGRDRQGNPDRRTQTRCDGRRVLNSRSRIWGVVGGRTGQIARGDRKDGPDSAVSFEVCEAKADTGREVHRF